MIAVVANSNNASGHSSAHPAGAAETSFVDIRIWQVPQPVRASAHRFKYSLALVSDALCVLRYDNEAGKGDHKHIGTEQIAYAFERLEKLQDDFWKDVDRWMTQQTRP